MDNKAIIKLLYDTGHFFSPLCPDGHDLSESDLDSLDISSTVVGDAIRSYQDFMCNSLDPLAMHHYNRSSIPDGKIGPATTDLFNQPRCGCADYKDPKAATGNGSWPTGCHGPSEYHQVTYKVDKSRMPKSESAWEEVEKAVVEAYASIGIEFQLVDKDANIRVLWQVLGGSVIGLAQFNNRSCGDSVFCKLNPNYWPNFDQVARLWCHEAGHNCNLEHTRGGVMNPSITQGPFRGWEPSDPSYNTLKRYFGGTPIPKAPVPNPPPGPQPPIGDVVLSGTIEVFDNGGSKGRFIFVPKPEV